MQSEYDYDQYEALNEREDAARTIREREDETTPERLATPIQKALVEWLELQQALLTRRNA